MKNEIVSDCELSEFCAAKFASTAAFANKTRFMITFAFVHHCVFDDWLKYV